MNTYYKYAPNVFLAKCQEHYEKGEIIPVTTKHGKENECIIFNLIAEQGGFYFYSIVRADGFNYQEWAKNKAKKLQKSSEKAEKESDSYYNRSKQITDNIPIGQPILIGHHSEKKHRSDLDKSWNAMGKSVELSKKSKEYGSKAGYYQQKSIEINLSMPESIEFYEKELENAKERHLGLKNGTIEREHSFSLTYAKKEVNELEKKLKFAQKLWA